MKKKQINKKSSLPRRMSVINSKSRFDIVEAYKAARTNLMFSLGANGKKCKTIAFTSTLMAEGKSTNCINIAITFAQTGSKVLIIDADMRKAKIHRVFNISCSPGLSDKLSGLANECIYEISKDNLYVLAAGTIPPNPTELLMSKSMDKLIEELEERFDYIFIDTPPVGVVTDAAIISNKVMGTVIIARQNVTTKDNLKNTIETLDRTGGKILGIIFNDVEHENKEYTNSYVSYGYKNYSGTDNDDLIK